jgi:hypothetical protein
MRVIRIHAAASDEAVEAAAWYEAERRGLGTEFERAIDAALDLLEQEVVPLAALPGEASARGAKHLMLRRFPYSVVVYEHKTDLIIVAFAHHARRPGYWRNRLST